jgi:hypothetical protein
MRFLFTVLLSVILFSCKNKTAPTSKTVSGDSLSHPVVSSASESEIQLLIDSIKACKPIKLSISEDHSDVDELIPIGYNDHGTIAFLINENSGGASGLFMGIIPAYEDFKMETKLDMDEEPDSILEKNKAFIYYALRSQGIVLKNDVQIMSADSLQKIYGIKFDIKKTYGPVNPDDPSGKKTLASIEMNWKQGDTPYPSNIINEKYSISYNVYDSYISDCLVVKGAEGEFGFVVVVTEERGFEGYTRKSIEVIHLGVIKSKN